MYYIRYNIYHIPAADMQKRDDLIDIYIEISKGSNVKYEYNKETKRLEIDRILPPPFFYPYAYGFIPGTLADDGDELDALILTDDELHIGNIYHCRVVGVMIMEDEKGMDEKILAVPTYDCVNNDIPDIHPMAIDCICEFFATYKIADNPHKWSRVEGVQSKYAAVEIVKQCRLARQMNDLSVN